MTIVAEHYRFVIGADTHAASHSLAAIEAATGARTASEHVESTTAGRYRALEWRAGIGSRAETLIVIEGIGS